MKSLLPLFALALLLTSCAAYKNGQTPDDVYYSPQRTIQQRSQASDDEYLSMDRHGNRLNQYSDEENYDDYYLRMKVRNRDRWSTLDNDLYFNNYMPYSSLGYGGYGYNMGYGYNPYMGYNPYGYSYFGNPFYSYNGFGLSLGYGYPSYSYFGNYYNPYSYYSPYGYNNYGHPSIVVNPRGPVYNRPRTSNLNIFNNRPLNNGSSPRTRIYNNSYNNNSYTNDTYENNSRSRNTGNELRNSFNNNSSNNNSFSAPSRPASTPSSSGGSAPVRRF